MHSKIYSASLFWASANVILSIFGVFWSGSITVSSSPHIPTIALQWLVGWCKTRKDAQYLPDFIWVVNTLINNPLSFVYIMSEKWYPSNSSKYTISILDNNPSWLFCQAWKNGLYALIILFCVIGLPCLLSVDSKHANAHDHWFIALVAVIILAWWQKVRWIVLIMSREQILRLGYMFQCFRLEMWPIRNIVLWFRKVTLASRALLCISEAASWVVPLIL